MIVQTFPGEDGGSIASYKGYLIVRDNFERHQRLIDLLCSLSQGEGGEFALGAIDGDGRCLSSGRERTHAAGV